MMHTLIFLSNFIALSKSSIPVAYFLILAVNLVYFLFSAQLFLSEKLVAWIVVVFLCSKII